MQLGNIDRCRIIYDRFIECQPDNSSTWVKYAEMENYLGERDRCVGIYELAILQNLDMPEIVWKSYINMEIADENYNKVRNLYERLLNKTRHVKVWLSFAKFEADVDDYEKAREVYERAYRYFKGERLGEERLLILENWIKFEESNENEEMISKLKGRLPGKIKKRRKINNDEQEDAWEEYYDLVFPDDEESKPEMKILQHALKWKMLMDEANAANNE